MTGSVTPLVNLHLRSRPVLLSSGQRRHSSRSLKRGQRALPFLLLLVFPSLGWWSGLILKDIQAMFDTFSHHHVCFQLQYLTHKSKVFIKLSLAVVISNFLFFLTSMPEQFWKLHNKKSKAKAYKTIFEGRSWPGWLARVGRWCGPRVKLVPELPASLSLILFPTLLSQCPPLLAIIPTWFSHLA